MGSGSETCRNRKKQEQPPVLFTEHSDAVWVSSCKEFAGHPLSRKIAAKKLGSRQFAKQLVAAVCQKPAQVMAPLLLFACAISMVYGADRA